MGMDKQTNGRTNGKSIGQIFTQYSGISSHSLRGVWICAAMCSCAQTQHSHNLYQGVGGTMFLQIMIINITPLVHNQEEQKEESNQSYKMKHGFLNHLWDCIHKVLKRAEYAFNMFMDTEVIWYILQAKLCVKFWMMEPSLSFLHAKSARYYNAVGFGIKNFF